MGVEQLDDCIKKGEAMRALLVVVILLVVSGCSPKYFLHYQTEIAASDNCLADEEIFEFSLQPVYNGILFTVENKSSNTAKIIWDKTYFILPNGNSYKALNTDILDEQHETVQKAEYISTIPSRSTFSRFTTAATKVNRINYVEVSEFYTRWNYRNSSSALIFEEELFVADSYWPLETENKKGGEPEDLLLDPIPMGVMGNFIKANNKLGFGLVIEMEGIETEYRFDIKILGVDALSATKKYDRFKGKYEYVNCKLEYSYRVQNTTWEKIGQPWVPINED